MEIPYRKIFIYILTFVAYAYTGVGSNMLRNLKDAVLSAESVFGDMLGNAIKVAEKFRSLHEVFDAAVEEECIYSCPEGVKPTRNRNHVPKSDGCGSLGLNISPEYLPLDLMTKCCNTHDICYDTCNSGKEVCDLEFKKCLYNYCDTYKSVNVAGEALSKEEDLLHVLLECGRYHALQERFLDGVPLENGLLNIVLSNPLSHGARSIYLLWRGCKAAAKLLFTGTLTLGCKSYLDAQKNACYCPPPKNKYKKYPGGGEL